MDLCKFKANLAYKVSSRKVKATQRNPASKSQKQTNNNNNNKCVKYLIRDDKTGNTAHYQKQRSGCARSKLGHLLIFNRNLEY